VSATTARSRVSGTGNFGKALGIFVATGALLVSATPAMAQDQRHAYTCTGGSVPTGTYSSVTIAGFCDVVPDAVITVTGNLDVSPGALFDAQSAPSTITVGRNVIAESGALVGLGCQPDYFDANGNHIKTGHPCAIEPDGHSTITVNGNVIGDNADTVLLNGTTVMGNVQLSGGGGDIPWSIKNNMIGRNLKIEGVSADWLGVLFNNVGGNVSLTDITATDPGDPGRLVFVVRNVIGKNLSCENLSPGVSGGFFPGSVNVVGGRALGQCSALV